MDEKIVLEAKSTLEAVKLAREKAPERKFKQTFDLAISLRDLDLKKPDHKMKEEVLLPHGHGKQRKFAAVAEGEVAVNAKAAGITLILGKPDLVKLAKNKRETKTMVNKIDVFIAQPDLMVEVGKTLGQILGPRGKMPKPVPPAGNLKPILERLNKITRIQIKDQPIIHCAVGTEILSDEQIVENLTAVLNVVKQKLPRGVLNIRSINLKLTMGPAVKILEGTA